MTEAQKAALDRGRELAWLSSRRLQRAEVPDGCPLTNREWQIVSLLAEGMLGKQIALELGIGKVKVAERMQRARERIGARTTAHLIAECFRAGWFDEGPGTPFDQALRRAA